MELHTSIDPALLERATCLAESGEMALYATGSDAYLFIHRHASRAWTGVSFSGDGVFRLGELGAVAMRHLYRDVASNLSPIRAHEVRKTSVQADG